LGESLDAVDDLEVDHARVVGDLLLEEGNALEQRHSGWFARTAAADWSFRSIYRLVMTALVCPDKFRGTLTAAEAAAAMAAGGRGAGVAGVTGARVAGGGGGGGGG